MTLFSYIHYESGELFALAKSNPAEFEKFAEADNMITFCEAIENAYNVEMFLLKKTSTCYISFTDKMREALSLDLFLVNVGLKSEISINFDIFRQALETLKKLESLIVEEQDGSQRRLDQIGVAWRLGACVDFNHLEETKERFDSQNLISEECFGLFEKNIERKKEVARRGLTQSTIKREDFKLPNPFSVSIGRLKTFRVFFDGDRPQIDDRFEGQTLDVFFKQTKNEMEEASSIVFPQRNGIFQRVNVDVFFAYRPVCSNYILSLRFDGRRDVGPRGVFVLYNVLCISEKEKLEESDLNGILLLKPFNFRSLGVRTYNFITKDACCKVGKPIANRVDPGFMMSVLQKLYGQHGFIERLNIVYNIIFKQQKIVLSSACEGNFVNKSEEDDINEKMRQRREMQDRNEELAEEEILRRQGALLNRLMGVRMHDGSKLLPLMISS